MAKETPSTLRNLIIYEVYVRNHTPEGTFKAFNQDLPRIKKMGVDVIWFMPIHPIGKLNKKGTLGCPYSISDYRAVNPEYGTEADFRATIQAIHDLGMKVMIDVVYNHTAHDSLLVRDHPEFFHQDETGTPVTTVPDWSDVIDLKHPNPELTRYLIDSLLYWSKLGVDGYRCDVASLVPIEFWLQARAEVALQNPETIWLAEAVHAGFLEYRHKMGLSGYSDSEIYQAFDMSYDYDIWPIFQAAIQKKVPLNRYLEMCRFQEGIYPANFIKMRCVENHDQVRIMDIAANEDSALAWAAFEIFNRGAFLIYAGQESGVTHKPSLFEKELIQWGNFSLQEFYSNLFKLKKHPLIEQGVFTITKAEPAILAHYSKGDKSLVGVFNPNGVSGSIQVKIPDGSYSDVISGKAVTIQNHHLSIPHVFSVFEVPYPLESKPFISPLLDHEIETDFDY